MVPSVEAVGSDYLRKLIEPTHPQLSISRQCELLGLARPTYYYKPQPISELNLELLRRLDQQYLLTPFYGIQRMTAVLKEQGFEVNHKRVARLMHLMGLEIIYPKPNLSRPGQGSGHRLYPYLLRDVAIERVNQVWSTDITFLPMPKGFLYLVAIMDWYSRYVLSWEISVTVEVEFCLDALERALRTNKPEIFNTDQGSQFTSSAFTGRLETAGIRISMDGKGRALDNIWVERLWRSVKYEDYYLKVYSTVDEVLVGLGEYFDFYNHRRPHQSLGYRTPASVYFNN